MLDAYLTFPPELIRAHVLVPRDIQSGRNSAVGAYARTPPLSYDIQGLCPGLAEICHRLRAQSSLGSGHEETTAQQSLAVNHLFGAHNFINAEARHTSVLIALDVKRLLTSSDRNE